MLKLANDFEYASLYKEGKCQKEILEYFWKKYQPLVKSVVSKYYRFHTGTLEFEDCIQNSFIYMTECLDILKIEKIKSKDKFSFGSYLKFKLRGANSHYIRKDSKISNKSVVVFSSNYLSDSTTEFYSGIIGRTPSYSHIGRSMLNAMTSTINVEDQVFNSSAYDRLRELTYKFYSSCNMQDKKLFALCVDKNTTNKETDLYYWVNKAKFLKKGYSKSSRKTNEITKQYFYQKVDKLERAFVQFVQNNSDFYSKSSLRANGLGKLS